MNDRPDCFIGCPNWGIRAWVGLLFTRDASPERFLEQYALAFNAVEGNTTFYGVPAEATVEKWRRQTPPSFRFCFKFPRYITHEARLVGAADETRAFLSAISPLGDRLGPLMLQMPPSFSPESLGALERYLDGLPADFRYAVEVRNRGYFAGSGAEALDAALAERGATRIVFDVRALSAADPSDRVVREALRTKPNVPVHLGPPSATPLVRFVGHPLPAANRLLLNYWAGAIEEWLAEGRSPHVFVHAPDDRFAPYLARELQRAVARRMPTFRVPEWPADTEAPPPEQLGLFD